MPGPINEEEDLAPLLVDEAFLKYNNDYFGNNHLKTSLKEDEDYTLLSHDAWVYLHNIYGGTDMPRISIQVAKEDDESEDQHEYMVEVYFKRIFLYILPKVKYHLCLKKPSSIFISRKATVLEMRKRIAEILNDNKKEFTVKDLMNLARIWRLDTGEHVNEIEKYFDYESRSFDNLPLEIRGRILQDNEIVEDINVADTDVLLYEIKYSEYLKQNNHFAFIPKQKVAKNRKPKHKNFNDLKEDEVDE